MIAPSRDPHLRTQAPARPGGAARSAAARAAAGLLGVAAADIATLAVFKRSFDARKAELLAVYIVDLALADPAHEAALLARHAGHPHVARHAGHGMAPAAWRLRGAALRPVVIGFGPCGIFAALMLAQMGLKPIVLERGKAVRERTKDTWGLWRKRVLKPESNVQFGEGGAGTFSDGKLYSQIKDPRHLGRKVMHEFVKAGAPDGDPRTPRIPHIGTFQLVKMVETMREQIIALGGEIRFEQRGDRLADRGRPRCAGCAVLHQDTGDTSELRADHVVLALGHSARDTFEMLHERGVYLEAKPFSIGFRIEHPQGLIDRARWGRHAGHPLLGAADYKLVHHAGNGRAVYSFCMCPGGTVVAATSRAGPRRHQRHEPVLAQRAQRQRRHRGAHRRPTTIPAGRWPASRCSASWSRAPSCSAAAPTSARPAGRRLPGRHAVDRVRRA